MSVVYQEHAQKWSNEAFDKFRHKYGPYCYVGFPSTSLTPADYYGLNTKRLLDIKEKYDPLGMLNYPGSL